MIFSKIVNELELLEIRDLVTENMQLVEEPLGDKIKVSIFSKSNCKLVAKRENGSFTYFYERDLEKFRDLDICECCKLKRKRETFYIIEKDNELKQVGKNCLKNYVNEFLNESLETQRILNELKEIKRTYYLIEELFYKIYPFIKEKGYRKEQIKREIDDLECKENGLFNSFKEYFEKMNENTFILNCKEILKSKYTKNIGIVIWMVNDFIECSKDTIYDFFGKIGDKVKDSNLVVKEVSVRMLNNPYTFCSSNIPEYTLVCEDLNGKYLMIHTTDSIDYKVGDVIKSLTVKNQKEYKGIKKTFINRVKI